jgi:DNA repair exonuclease SbcCD ATPase subunit
MASSDELKSVEGLLSHLTHDKKHERIPAIHDELLGARYNGAVSKAGSSVPADQLNAMTARVEEIKGLKETAEALRKDGLDAGKIEKLIEKQQAGLNKDAATHYRGVAKHAEHHGMALEELAAQRAKLEEQLAKAHTKKIAEVSKTLKPNGSNASEVRTQIDNLKHNYDLAREHVADHFEAKMTHHKDAIDAVKSGVKDLEKESGVSAAEFKIGEKALAAEGKVGEEAWKKLGMGEKVKKVWQSTESKTGKFARVAATGLGVIGLASGLMDIARGAHMTSPKTDDEGKEIPAGGGDIMLGIGKAAVGLGAVYAALIGVGKGKVIAGHAK